MPPVKHELGKAIEARRKELGLTPTALAEAAGVTLQGLVPLRAGKHRAYQERLTYGVCRALHWTPDSIDRLMQGLPAIEVNGEDLPPAPMRLEDRVTQLEVTVGGFRPLVQQFLDLQKEVKGMKSELRAAQRRRGSGKQEALGS